MQVTYGLLEPFHHGRGYQKPLTATNPAAGANYTHTVNPDSWERLLSIAFTLTTSATVANRIVTVQYADPQGHVWAADGAGVLVTASTTAQQFYGSNKRGNSEWYSPSPVFFPLWGGFMPPGSKITINVQNIDTTDQLATIVGMLEKFETNESGYITGGIDSETFAAWYELHAG